MDRPSFRERTAEEEIFGEDEEDFEEEEGEDLFGDGMEGDYAAKPGLDSYAAVDLDEREYEAMSYSARAAAEQMMAKRDKGKQREQQSRSLGLGRLPTGLFREEEEEDIDEDYRDGYFPEAVEEDEEDDTQKPRRRRKVGESAEPSMMLPDLGDELLQEINLGEKKGPLREWIVMDAPRRQIALHFRRFLTTFDSGQGKVYPARISSMCAANEESLVVDYPHLSQDVPVLALYLADAPTEMLSIFDEVAMLVVLSVFPEYGRIHKEVHVRIAELPLRDSLRDLRQAHLNCLVRVNGVVTRRTGVFPQLKYAKYDCTHCKEVVGPFFQGLSAEIKVPPCPNCDHKGPFLLNAEQTVYRNYQKITLQESPGTVPAGRLPRTKDVILLWDLIDTCRPGEEIEITGIYRNNFDASLNSKHGFPVFATIIEANYITKRQDGFAAFRLTEEDEKQILKLAKDPSIGERIIKSIAPSIYGHEDIKTAIALALFGGQAKYSEEQQHRIRGDINVLLMGDPGTAKSQFLKYAEKTAHRAVYTTGQGASAVGLTAAVHKDPLTGEWTLEGGALVLADKGICLIDEFDKMNDKDRTSIHEAMEQQSISISKAGIVATLQARCSVIAAANPIGGRYRPQISFAENVELTEPILSRFDILCVVRDTVDPIIDECLASFVVNSHLRSHPEFIAEEDGGGPVTSLPVRKGEKEKEPISQDMLRKYITYAKRHCFPQLRNPDMYKLENLYAELRAASQHARKGIPATVRYIESLIRVAESHARMHLREFVSDEDVNVAIRVMVDSFISAQPFSVARMLKKKFRRYITFRKDNDELLFHLLQSLVREETLYAQVAKSHQHTPQTLEIPCDDFETRAREMDIGDVQSFYKSSLFRDNGFVLEAKRKVILFSNSS
ncbi:MCM DNA helicase complex subunit [Balamuthia mandrillaris]